MDREDQDENILDLSDKALKKVLKLPDSASAIKVTKLNFDNNRIYKLENMNQFPSVVEFSAHHNILPRMYGVSALVHLVKLNLSDNNITMIEGLKELVHLNHLNLARNKIKAMDGLQMNLQLEHLDLSENKIMQIDKIGHLVALKKLYLQKNLITHLRFCEHYVPQSLEVLNLADNKISDLTEISHLGHIMYLKDISIAENPCLSSLEPGSEIPYRPYLLNWFPNLTVIDGFAAGEIESLQGEWLYSQGNGRKFKIGQHKELSQYLLENCIVDEESLDSCGERKLKIILSKARQHKSQIIDQQIKEEPTSIMSRSLDPSLFAGDGVAGRKLFEPQKSVLSRSLHEPKFSGNMFTDLNKRKTNFSTVAPLPAASKMVPVPESLISPMVTTSPALVTPSTSIKTNCTPNRSSSEHPIPSMTNTSAKPSTADTVSPCKLKTIKSKVEERRVQNAHLSDTEKAAICIQRIWRGHKTRNSPKIQYFFEQLQQNRTHKFIQKLSEDMEATRAALDNEHKLQLLQMQAINALWRKVVSLQPSKIDENITEVKDLAVTCDRLNNQVQQLQSCMKDVLRCASPSSSATAMGTQTDIIAVHTPCESDEHKFLQNRPSSLALLSTQNQSTNTVPDVALQKPPPPSEEC